MASTEDIAAHDERRLKVTCPEDFKRIMKENSLDKEFIDWAVSQGYKIWYHSYWSKGHGAVLPSARNIHVSTNNGGDPNLTDLILVHELIHIAVSAERLDCDLVIYNEKEYEETIDKLAKEYIRDADFMSYLKENMPSRSED